MFKEKGNILEYLIFVVSTIVKEVPPIDSSVLDNHFDMGDLALMAAEKS